MVAAGRAALMFLVQEIILIISLILRKYTMSLGMSVLHSVLGFIAALALAGALVPAFALAQTTPYNYYNYGNCNSQYSITYPYNNGYYPNGYCPQGTLFVYVQVNAPANSFYSRPPSDFTIIVSGGNAYPATVPGSTNGQLISVLGSYSVTAASFQGFTPSYSSGCTGTVSQGQQASCVITETPIYPYNYQPNYPYQQNYQYPNQYPYYNKPYLAPYTAPTVYVTPTYVPRLPNTGFEPQTAAAAVLVVLIAMAFLSLPYVRKALASILG